MAKELIEVQGIPFKSLEKLAEHFGFAPTTLSRHKKKYGKSWEETIQHYQKPVKVSEEFEFEGRTFMDADHACRYYGYNLQKVRSMAYAEDLPFKAVLRGYLDGIYPIRLQPVKVGEVTYPTEHKMREHFGVGCKRITAEQRTHIEDYLHRSLYKALPVKYPAAVAYLKGHGFSLGDITAYYVNTGICPQKMQKHHETHGYLPKLNGIPCYINYHTLPSLAIACLWWDVDIKKVRTKMHSDRYSANGAFQQVYRKQ